MAGAGESKHPPIIVSEGLKKQFNGLVAVRDATFEVPRGSIFGFIGPSGSGKTTMIRMMTGVYAPTDGRVTVLGSDPKKFSRGTRARLGYMPQHFALYKNLSIWENLTFAASLYGMGLMRGRQLGRVLDVVELDEHRNTLARDASGGMQRRLSLAATLVHDPELIFLDEPTAGIDPILRRKLWDHFRELQRHGRSLFITTQYVSEAAYCDLVGVINEGKMVAVDTPDALRKRAFGGDTIELVSKDVIDFRQEQSIRDLPFVRNTVRTGPSRLRVVVDEAKTATPALLEWARAQNMTVESVEEFVPPFEDVFVELVEPEVKNV